MRLTQSLLTVAAAIAIAGVGPDISDTVTATVSRD